MGPLRPRRPAQHRHGLGHGRPRTRPVRTPGTQRAGIRRHRPENLERHPYQRVTDTPSTPEPSAVAMRIHGPAATGVYVTPLIAKVICPDLLPVV